MCLLSLHPRAAQHRSIDTINPTFGCWKGCVIWKKFRKATDFLSVDPAIVNALRECIAESAQSWRMGGFPIGVVATSDDTSRIPASILSSFKHQLEFEVR